MTKTGSAVRLRKRELFRSIGYTPHAGQERVHRSTASRRTLVCGSRWGKTLCGVYESVAALIEPREESLGWLVAPTFELSDRVFAKVAEVFQAKLPHRIRELDWRGHRLVVTNLEGGRSELKAKSADQPASLLGEALDWLVVDEASRLRRDVWENHLAQRLLDRRGWALLLSTPRGCDWFFEAYRKGQGGRDPDCESWCSPSWENPYVDRALIEAERGRLGQDAFDQEYGAKFLGEDDEPCATCCFDKSTDCGLVLMGDEDGPGPPTCPDCGSPIDAEGWTLYMPEWARSMRRAKGVFPRCA